MTLAKADSAEDYNFSLLWKIPRLAFEVSSGSMKLNDIFLMSYGSLETGDISTRIPVLGHLQVE